MPGQEQQRPSRREDEAEDVPAVPAQGAGQSTAKSSETDADVDALLDEIDEVLESNSEEFVRGFVQKGGQ